MGTNRSRRKKRVTTKNFTNYKILMDEERKTKGTKIAHK